MSKKQKINAKTKLIISLVLIAVLAAIPTLYKQFDDKPVWEETAKKVGIVENSDMLNYPFNVHFVDVGQGSCTLITSDFGNIMFDCGEKDQISKLANYLQNLKIEKIDYLIASHPHSDHIGCMYSIVNNYDIGKFFMPELDEEDIPTTVTYERLLESLDRKNVDSSYMKIGDTFRLV